MTASNMKKRCLACENHFVSVSSFLTQSNAKIVLKGFYFSISQTTFFTRPFYTFFSFEDVSQPFSGSDQYIHTFLQASLDRKHFQRLEKLLNHDHHRSVKQVMFSYCLFEYFLSTHFFHCRKAFCRRQALVIQTTLASCIPFVAVMWIYCLYCLHSGIAFATFG